MLVARDGSRPLTPLRYPCSARRLRIPAQALSRQTAASTLSPTGRGGKAGLPLPSGERVGVRGSQLSTRIKSMKRPNVDHARALRSNQTDAERALWRQLRERRLLGWKFRRQHEVGPYIADFVCADAWLIIELDGGQHVEQVARDARRTAWLQREEHRVLRFWNDEVLKGTETVLERIVVALDMTSPHPGSLPVGERGQGSDVDGFSPSPLRGEGRSRRLAAEGLRRDAQAAREAWIAQRGERK